ncbi:MAG: glycoside hydrolase family 2 protein [Rhodobacteraceae bacterium]|nr:glycoside hydrolase family 2 protein [Paracoccaceae bacterium]
MVDLAGNWALKDATGTYDLMMALPGDSVSALCRAGIIEEPYWGKNEYDARWIADRDWTATRKFEFKPDGAPRVLSLSGLDCVAKLRLNGQPLFSASNAFRTYSHDISDLLVAGENTLEIDFLSNTAEANRRQAAQPFEVPYNEGNSDIANGNMLRKCQCDFGWDWNLAVAPFGITGDIYIEKSENRIKHIGVQQSHSKGAVTLDISVALADVREGPRYSITIDGQTVQGEITGNVISADITIEAPQLWWPAGLGAQRLYKLEVTVGAQTTTRNIGLRTVALHTEPDEKGAEFTFAVNGHRIFARGANWIPQDALSGRITQAATRDLLQSAKDANMNMIRVWGGGRYEADWFYDMCSEMGLLVWQDFMFSCNLYPSDPAFLADIAQEVSEQVARLSHHACLALWCGDNELIGALGWYEPSINNRDRYLVAYDRLNRTIETALKTTDENALWWPSSPSSGVMNFGDAWHDDSAGDMHYWAVWHEGKSFDNYREIQPRFCSEFGFQSFPSMNTIRKFAAESDMNIGSPIMESHQKNAGGNARITETMFRYFRFPEGFENFVYLSQVQQGLAMQTAVEYWRSLKPHCMGALYWQLNDTWPTMSWSSLNHGGDWKSMHFMAREFFQPVAVFAIPEGDTLKLVAVNDGLEACEIGVDLVTISMDGIATPIKTIKAVVGPDVAETVFILQKERIPEGHIMGYSFRADNEQSGNGHFTPVPYKQLELQNSQVSFETEIAGDTVIIRTTVSALALFVTIEAGVSGRFSNNCYRQLPNETVEITFTPKDARADDAAKSIAVRDLYSATYKAVSNAAGDANNVNPGRNNGRLTGEYS